MIAYESSGGFNRGVDLFINQQDGTFKQESELYGINLNQYFKGVVATDVNNDKFPDLYFSTIDSKNYLFINQSASGKKAFTLVPGLEKPDRSFSCFSFDYDNDGYEDIFVSAYTNDGTPVNHWMKSHMGNADPEYMPKLFHNKGNLTFEETEIQMGLTEVVFTMGCNFGDLNTDGFLDFYLGTGNPLYQSLIPNKAYLNMGGKKFEDVSYNGFANIQKGHAVSFGDLDHDGDEDLYLSIGGAYDGDDFFNSLLENPNENHNNWLILNLEGTESNKLAIGARVIVNVEENGHQTKICRVVSSGASFGGNSLELEIGLGKGSKVNSVVVEWPCLSCQTQTFTGIAINSAYKLTQGEATAKPVEYKPVKFGMSANASEHHHHH